MPSGPSIIFIPAIPCIVVSWADGIAIAGMPGMACAVSCAAESTGILCGMPGICACDVSGMAGMAGMAGIGSMTCAGAWVGAAAFVGAPAFTTAGRARVAAFVRGAAFAGALAGAFGFRFAAGLAVFAFGAGIGIFMPGIPGIVCFAVSC